MKYSYDRAKEIALTILKAGKTVFLKGHPGVGKSTMALEIATQLGFDVDDPKEFIELRLGQKDPGEICGTIFPNVEEKKCQWLKPDWAPTEKAAFIFLDEINAGVTKLHQSVAYQITLDKAIAGTKFAPGTVVMAAGNLEEDHAITAIISSALNNRCAHLILKVSVDDWLEWALKAGIDARIRAFISFRREQVLYNNDGNDAFPTPRSWANVSDVIKGEEDVKLIKRLTEVFVGEAQAQEFVTWLEVYSRINLKAILEHGQYPDLTAAENKEPSFLYALSFAIADAYTASKTRDKLTGNLFGLFKVKGYDNEYQAILLKHLTGNDEVMKSLILHPDFITVAKDKVDLMTCDYKKAA